MTAQATDPVARFWNKVDKNGPVAKDELGPCWQWLGVLHRGGYGRHSPGQRVIVYAHRFAYELLVGPVPEGLQPDHLCRNRGCVNPAHLEPVTQRENMLRGIGPQAVNARKTHCPEGHPLDGEHLYVTAKPNGGTGRRCRTCNTQKAREYRARLAARRVAA